MKKIPFTTPLRAIMQHKSKLPQTLGSRFVAMLSQIYFNISFMGELSYQFMLACRHPSRVRWKDVWKFMEIIGPNALPIVALLGFLFGLILSFQGVLPLQKFGADIYIIRLVGTSVIREMAALMTAIIIIARTSSAFAAEIGTMKINREIDALSTMGIEPIRFLVMPRMLAVIVMMPALTVFLTLFSFIGCYVVASSLGYGPHIFFSEMRQAFDFKDILLALFKSLVFGTLVAGIGCIQGLKTQAGALAVGQSTTNAVVSGIGILTATDGIFAVLCYVLGI